MHLTRLLLLGMLFLLMAAGFGSADGRSVEDLVGVFSLEKTIRLGSSSQCFAPPGLSDPLSPPQMLPASALADDQPPSLAGFAFEPAKVSAGRQREINFTVHAVDDQSGLWAAALYLRSPSGRLAEVLFPSQSLISGTPRDGVYSARLLFPQPEEKGIWRLENLTLVDMEGNRRTLQKPDLIKGGFPAELRVA
jgi:hypothetical protein